MYASNSTLYWIHKMDQVFEINELRIQAIREFVAEFNCPPSRAVKSTDSTGVNGIAVYNTELDHRRFYPFHALCEKAKGRL